MRKKSLAGALALVSVFAVSAVAARPAGASAEQTCKKSWLVPGSCSICGALDDQDKCTCTSNCNNEE
jgi:hypothetical protein